MTDVLLVEDDRQVRELVRALLEADGFVVREAKDATVASIELLDRQPGLVILDLGLPDITGDELLKWLRQSTDVPVIVLSGRRDEVEKARLLNSGADDYVTKPYDPQELLARVHAVLRRSRNPQARENDYEDALIQIEVAAHRVTAAGREVDLTPCEYKLLTAFVRHPRELLTHARLLELVWDDPFALSPEEVRLYVSYLRRKLALDGRDPIETVRGFGYRFTPPETPPA